MIGRYHMRDGIPTISSDSMRVRILPSTEAAIVGPLWEEIEERVGTGGLACSWAWTETWLRHYGDLVPHRFVVGERNGPCAIALVTEGVNQCRGPFPVRTVHLGTAGEPDCDTVRVEYNRLLVAPRDRAAFASGILDAIESCEVRWEELQLDGFLYEEIASLVERHPTFEVNTQVCHIADLRGIRNTDGSVLGALRSHTAAKIRRSTRRLEEEHGPLRVEVAETRADAERIFEEMMGLHCARWEAAGRPGSFASRRFAGFHRDIVARLFDQGSIFLGRVSAGDSTIGCDYGFVERNRVLSYQWGLRQFEDKRLSPGLVTGATMMQAALERGLDEYDWLAGDVLYKRELSTTSRELVWASAPRGARIHVIYELVRAKRLAQRIRPLRAIAAVFTS